jgi:hypothetical protein
MERTRTASSPSVVVQAGPPPGAANAPGVVLLCRRAGLLHRREVGGRLRHRREVGATWIWEVVAQGGDRDREAQVG